MEKKEAMKILKDFYDKSAQSSIRTALDTVIPEITINWDERMKNAAIRACKYMVDNFENSTKDYEDVIVWLEKQGEPTDKGEISDGYHTFNELYCYKMLYNAAFFNLLPKNLVHKSKKYYDGEECFGGGWFIVTANLPTGQISNHYELKYWDLFNIPEKEFADKWDGHTPQEAAERLCSYLLEKQDNKKPTDKVEPKFKVGDWCIDNEDGTIFQIVKVLDNTYTYKTNEGKEYSCTHYSLENDAKLWTIQDAKDGDVLQLVYVTAIFKNYIGNKDCICYCSIYNDGGFEIPLSDGDDNVYGCIGAHPATKEQRDILFQKMTEAGYEWDEENKKLKKIKQNPANVFNIYEKSLLEKFKQAVYDCAWGKVTCKTEGETQEEYAERWAEQILLMVRDWADDYIDSREDAIRRRSFDKGFDKGKQSMQKPVWSEDDEQYLLVCKNALANDKWDANIISRWLESLKERVQTKQEWTKEDKNMYELKRLNDR